AHDLDVGALVEYRAEEVAADAAEAVDANPDGHRTHLLAVSRRRPSRPVAPDSELAAPRPPPTARDRTTAAAAAPGERPEPASSPNTVTLPSPGRTRRAGAGRSIS